MFCWQALINKREGNNQVSLLASCSHVVSTLDLVRLKLAPVNGAARLESSRLTNERMDERENERTNKQTNRVANRKWSEVDQIARHVAEATLLCYCLSLDKTNEPLWSCFSEQSNDIDNIVSLFIPAHFYRRALPLSAVVVVVVARLLALNVNQLIE